MYNDSVCGTWLQTCVEIPPPQPEIFLELTMPQFLQLQKRGNNRIAVDNCELMHVKASRIVPDTQNILNNYQLLLY